MTPKNATEFARIIIQQLLGCEPSAPQQEQLEKGKKGVKRPRKAKTVNSEYSLLSGKKISLGWLLIIKLLQSNFSRDQNDKK